MRLADFLTSESEPILAAWEAFAATQMPAAASMQPLALRDHAEQILQAVVVDLRTAQSREAQLLKSRGLAPKLMGAPETAAQTHALLRARSGFDINQLAAEYRALRASVLRLWMDRCEPARPDTEDMIRFNEAMDQALAESITFFSAQVEQSRNLLLGMLGHDMRTPLQTVLSTARLLAQMNTDAQVSSAAQRLIDSGKRIKLLLDDLLDFGRTRLGLGIRVDPHDADIASLFASELEQLRSLYPDRTITLQCAADCRGWWDGMRLQQLLENLVVNAIKYGDAASPVGVTVAGGAEVVVIEVRNSGPTIEQPVLDAFFDPLRRGADDAGAASGGEGLGLGLYIAREVARAHGGDLVARSHLGNTVFRCTLPRRR